MESLFFDENFLKKKMNYLNEKIKLQLRNYISAEILSLY